MPTGGGFTGCCGPDGKSRADQELEVLCDASGAPFLRRYTVDGDGAVTSVDTELDGTTAFEPAEPIGVCASSNGGKRSTATGTRGIPCTRGTGSPTNRPATTNGAPRIREDTDACWWPDSLGSPATTFATMGGTGARVMRAPIDPPAGCVHGQQLVKMRLPDACSVLELCRGVRRPRHETGLLRPSLAAGNGVRLCRDQRVHAGGLFTGDRRG